MRRAIWIVCAVTLTLTLACATAAAQASPPPEFTTEQVRTGSDLYERYCANCHGVRMEGVEAEYDLRKFAPNDRARFFGAVFNGIRTMPPWNGLLTPQQIESLWAYTMSRRTASATNASPANLPPAPAGQEWPCGSDSQLLVDNAGAPVWIGSDELRSRGTNMPQPALPSSANPSGKRTVDVLVDSQGRVRCVRSADGDPRVRSALTDAVAKWTFKPFSAGGRPVAVYGRLEFVLGN